jgi:hypothetical protein
VAVIVPHGSHRTVRQSGTWHSATAQMRCIPSHASRRITVGQSQHCGQQLDAGVIMQSASALQVSLSFESVDPSPVSGASSSTGCVVATGGAGSAVAGAVSALDEAALVVVVGALALSPPHPSEPRTSAKSTDRIT